MKRIKHAKVKNTGIVFELLVRQVASDTMNNKNSKNREKYIKIRKANLHKMEPIPVCKMKND